MAIDLNSNALNVYRNAAFADVNTIIKQDGSGIAENGVYTGRFSAITRTSADKAANNEARAALLKSLGQAFNVGGMRESDGKVTFSKDFMKTLEKILGPDFKSGDFGVNSNGEVTSGKPLTMRRIKAIVDKADLVGKGSFNLSIYEKKIDAIMKDLKIDKLSDADLEKLAGTKREYKVFILVKKAIEFLKYEADKTIALHPAYEFEVMDCNNEYHGPKYQYFDRTADEMVDLSDLNVYENYLQRQLGGVPVHVMSNTDGFDPKNPETISTVKNYVGGVIKMFIKSTVDNYFDASAAGKKQEYINYVRHDLGVCLENQCRKLDEFAGEHLVTRSKEDIAAAAEAKRIADTAIENGAAPKKLETLICDVIGELIGLDGKYAELDDWNDFAEEVKKRLVGKNAAITTPRFENDGYVFKPVMEDGKILVRQLTAEDIDALGPACLRVINGEA